jgi:hypothetical protein
MNVERLYDNEDERRQHDRAMERVAREIHRPVEEVRPLYESELAALRQGARVKDFLSVLASRHVRLQLKRGAAWQ